MALLQLLEYRATQEEAAIVLSAPGVSKSLLSISAGFVAIGFGKNMQILNVELATSDEAHFKIFDWHSDTDGISKS